MQMINIVNLLIKHPSENKLLAVRRATTDNTYGGMWALPGGGIEKEESVRDAANRELTEETGLTLMSFDNKPLIVSPLEIRGKTYFIGVYAAHVEEGEIAPRDPDISNAEYIEPKVLIESLRNRNYPEEQIVILEKTFEKLFITSS